MTDEGLRWVFETAVTLEYCPSIRLKELGEITKKPRSGYLASLRIEPRSTDATYLQCCVCLIFNMWASFTIVFIRDLIIMLREVVLRREMYVFPNCS
jgi:hypothetical protein